MPLFTLRKSEILRSNDLLELLFASNQLSEIDGFVGRYTLYVPPFKCVYMFRRCAEDNEPLQTMFVVPKRNFKRAVVRNLLKRRTKESYRLSKNNLKFVASESRISVTVHICYYSKEVSSYKVIDNGIKKIISEIADKLACSIN